jgi:hypothetical protein
MAEPTGMTPQPSSEFERLVRIETKLDVFNQSYVDHEARIRALESDNTPGGHLDETRIRRLERSMWLAVGAGATGGGLIASVVGPLIGGH